MWYTVSSPISRLPINCLVVKVAYILIDEVLVIYFISWFYLLILNAPFMILTILYNHVPCLPSSLGVYSVLQLDIRCDIPRQFSTKYLAPLYQIEKELASSTTVPKQSKICDFYFFIHIGDCSIDCLLSIWKATLPSPTNLWHALQLLIGIYMTNSIKSPEAWKKHPLGMVAEYYSIIYYVL